MWQNRPFDKPLLDLLKSGKLRVKFPKGYRKWQQRFNAELHKTEDVKQALDNIHGKPPIT
jgi:hypothetical protein